jgi:hypothetical protein
MRYDDPAGAAWRAAGRFLLAAAVLAAFLCLAWPGPAGAAPHCAPYRRMATFLAERYGETPRAVGLVGEGRIVQVFAGAGGSWTILVTSTAGQTCILAAGEGWETIPVADPPAAPGDPA